MDIRPVRTNELGAVEALQQEVWRCNDLETVPALHMIPVLAVGGILLGAFEREELVGFVYGFPGFEGGQRIIHSDMLAVRESYRDRGLGRALKLAQREHALARGIRKITWTFDPFQPKNAYLNFTLLGARSRRYMRDFYGRTSSPLHRLGTDRLWIEWELEETARDAVPALQIALPQEVNTLTIETVRREFEDAFADGMTVTGFDRRRSAYTLARP
jgi:predicted GNAT superfamily acetyltransferase